MAKRKIYTEEYMEKCCNYVVIDGMSIVQAAKKSKIHHTMMRKWVKNSGDAPVKAKTASVKSPTLASELQAKIQHLRGDIAILEKAIDIL